MGKTEKKKAIWGYLSNIQDYAIDNPNQRIQLLSKLEELTSNTKLTKLNE